jgi:hypothetical protein
MASAAAAAANELIQVAASDRERISAQQLLHYILSPAVNPSHIASRAQKIIVINTVLSMGGHICDPIARWLHTTGDPSTAAWRELVGTDAPRVERRVIRASRL